MKNKFFIVFLIFLVVITSFSCVFAFDTTVSSGDVYSYPDEVVEYIKQTPYFNDDYICIGFHWSASNFGHKYFVLFFKKTENLKVYLYKHALDDFNHDHEWTITSNVATDVYRFSFDSSYNYLKTDVYSSFQFTESNFWNEYGVALQNNFYFSNGDIYNTDDTLFFPLPPATLEEIMEQELEQKATIQEILGVLPLIIVVVVSFLGLRKALKMLSIFLKAS